MSWRITSWRLTVAGIGTFWQLSSRAKPGRLNIEAKIDQSHPSTERVVKHQESWLSNCAPGGT